MMRCALNFDDEDENDEICFIERSGLNSVAVHVEWSDWCLPPKNHLARAFTHSLSVPHNVNSRHGKESSKCVCVLFFAKQVLSIFSC